MADLRTYNREFATEFISLYRSLPVLWQIKSKDYSDRNKKNAAYEVMINKLKEVRIENIKYFRLEMYPLFTMTFSICFLSIFV